MSTTTNFNFQDLVDNAIKDPVGLTEGYIRDGNGDPVPEIGFADEVFIDQVQLRETKNGFPRIMIMFYDENQLEKQGEQVMMFDNINFSNSSAANRITLQKLETLGCTSEIISGGPEAIVEYLNTIERVEVKCTAHDHGDSGRIFPRYAWNEYGNGQPVFRSVPTPEEF